MCRNGDGEHPGDDGARQFAHSQPGDEKKPCGGQPCLRLRQIAEGDQRDRIVDNHAGILQSDQRQEKADAGGNAELQAHWDGVDQPNSQG
jgi:hypothetical protein